MCTTTNAAAAEVAGIATSGTTTATAALTGRSPVAMLIPARVVPLANTPPAAGVAKVVPRASMLMPIGILAKVAPEANIRTQHAPLVKAVLQGNIWHLLGNCTSTPPLGTNASRVGPGTALAVTSVETLKA